MGVLERDPEMRTTPNDVAVVNFGMTITRKWTNPDGQVQERTEVIEVEGGENQAETICQFMKKGKPIMVEGRLKQDRWEDKETGQKRSKLFVQLQTFQFVDSAKSGEDNASVQAQGGGNDFSQNDDKVPF